MMLQHKFGGQFVITNVALILQPWPFCNFDFQGRAE